MSPARLASSTFSGTPLLSLPTRKRLLSVTIGLLLLQQFLLIIIPVVGGWILNTRETWHKLFAGNLTQWDSLWLLHIAKHGYTQLADTAFFPLYPLVIRLTHLITGLGFETAALVVSAVSFGVAVYVFGLWLSEHFSMRTTYVAMALLVLFPTAFYFRAAYTESLFLALVISAVYASSKGRFWIAGFLTSAAVMTRHTGLFVCVILAVDYIHERRLDWKILRRSWWKALDSRVLSLLLPPFVFAAYLVWLKWHTGYFLAFVQAEKSWHRVFRPPWTTLVGSVQQLIANHQPGLFPYHLFEFSAWIFGLCGLLASIPYLRRSVHHRGNAVYILIIIWTSASAPAHTGQHLKQWDYLLSMPRFDLMMFPAFAYLATRMRRTWVIILSLIASVGGLCLLYGLFCGGHFLA